MIWWYWVLLGLLLAVVEILTPGGFFFIFFAISSLLLGLLEVAGVAGSDPLQWVLFSALSVVCLALFRKPLLARMGPKERAETVDSLIGEVAVAVTPIPPGQHGRAELRGTVWSARNIGELPLTQGERGRVAAVRGLELDIRSERGH